MMRECSNELNAVQLVITVVIMSLKVMELQLLLRHCLCRLVYLTLKVLHYVSVDNTYIVHAAFISHC